MTLSSSPLNRAYIALTTIALGLITITSGVAAQAQTTFKTSDDGVKMTDNGVTSNPTVSTYFVPTTENDYTVTTPSLAAFNSGTSLGSTQHAWGAGGYAGTTFYGTTDSTSYIGNNSNDTGFYDYRFTFDAAAGSNFSGHALGDNEIQAVFVDGAALSLTSPNPGQSPIGGYLNLPSAANFSSVLGSGADHTFDIIVYNHDGATNVAFEGTAARPVPECGFLINGASLLGVAGLGMVRRRRSSKTATSAS